MHGSRQERTNARPGPNPSRIGSHARLRCELLESNARLMAEQLDAAAERREHAIPGKSLYAPPTWPSILRFSPADRRHERNSIGSISAEHVIVGATLNPALLTRRPARRR